MNKLTKWAEGKTSLGLLILRIFIGFRLVYGTIDNAISWARMEEFVEFLAENNFPFPSVCAVLSVYFQFFAGILITIGYKTRIAALLMCINFLIALFMVHSNHTVEVMTPALAMFFGCMCLFFTGSGRFSIEKDD